jgi:oxygen-independent coproporphyrinogen-3 oxidase
MEETLKKVILLKPERIAFYSFAFVPWLKPSQKLFRLSDLPSADLKWRFYLMAQKCFLNAGYDEIGIDHFSLPSDALSLAKRENRLHRNFMGYTDQKTNCLIGLGLSAISETDGCYHQNMKDFDSYQNAILNQSLATEKGHVLDSGEKVIKRQIQELLTCFSTSLEDYQNPVLHKSLKEFSEDKMIEIQDRKLRVLNKGRPFVRSICALFDQYYQNKTASQFSKTI